MQHERRDEREGVSVRRPLRVLFVDDSESDTNLQLDALKESGFDPFWKRVESRDELIAALETEWELVLSVCSLPNFSAKAALEVVRQKHLDLPFILVSGAVGEEMAAEMMRCGANDFVLKGKLRSLVPVVERELRDARKRREERAALIALRESERKYRSLVEQAFDGIAVIDGQGVFLEANRSALLLTGYSEQEIRDRSLNDLIDPDELRAVPLALDEVSRGQSIVTRRTVIRKDRSRLSVNISRTGLDDGRFLLILRDLSQQLETEAALLRREQHQRAIAELGRAIAGGASSQALMTRAADLIEKTLSVASCRIAEWNPDALDSAAIDGHIGEVFAADGPLPFDNRKTALGFHFGIGTRKHPLAIVEVRTASRRDVAEDERAFLRSLCDLLGSAIEQKRSEEARRRSEDRFRRYFDLGLVGMATTSPDKNCREVNDRLCEMLGFERSELLQLAWSEFTHPEDFAFEMPYYDAMMAGRSDGYSIDKRFFRKDGTILYATISVGCVRGADRSIDHIVALVQDVSERRRADGELFRREAEFKALVENSPDVIMRFSRDHRHLYASPVIERFTGIPASQFIGKTHRELGMPEEICSLFETALTEVFTTGEERVVAFTFAGPGGEQLFFQDRIVPEFDAAHEVESALSVTRDITAIHNSEARLRESEAQLATAQRMAHIGSWEMNLETGERTWSREVFRIMGIPAGDPPTEEDVLSAVHVDDRPAVLLAHQMATDTGEMQSLEHRISTADGSEHIFSILIEPGKNAEGRTVKLTGTVQDVTALRRTEHSLRQSEQRMRDLIESANDAIITLDGSGKVLEVNPAVVKLMHEPAEAIVGRHITHSIHPDHVSDIMSGLSTVIEKGGIAHIEAPVRTGRGDYVQIQASASRQSRKGADAIFVIGRDVTEQRRADSERRSLTRQIELLLASTYEGICSADLQGRCTLVNRAAAEMLGYPPSELLGKNLHDLIHHHRADGTPYDVSECPITLAAETGKPVRVMNEGFWRQNGTSFPVEIFISPILDAAGATLGIVASFIDVSERQFLQNELERANRLAGLGRVAATMSHEFNNVLMGIQPFAELLTRTSKDPKVVDAAKRISQSVQRGRRVTEELRGFTRPSEPVRRPVDVSSLLHDCDEQLRHLLPSNIELTVEVAKTPMCIEADRDQITQTVSNIVINARDAIGAARGTITLAARHALPGEQFSFGTLPAGQEFIHFSLCDDGPGIPKENLARIIEPFFTTKKNGTGLGLAITHQIITLHGGHMFVESKPGGGGTIVHLFLPSTSAREDVASLPADSSSRYGKSPSEILLIEDEDAVAAGLSVLLNDEGVKVVVAADGAEAMRVLDTWTPQALVVDISLPDCDGFELYERIVAKFGPMPAVFSSGHADHVKLADLGPDADVRLLTKPYDVETLLQELEQVCTAARRRRESMLLRPAS